MNYCGIDLASKASAICVMDPTGVVLKEVEFPTDEDGFRVELSRWPLLKCVLEASPLAEWAAQQVEALGHEVSVIDPRQAKAVTQTKKKTDRRDAHNLAQLCRTGWFTEVHRKSVEGRLLRTLLQARKGLVETGDAMNARIRGLLRAQGLKVGSVSEGAFAVRVEQLCKSQTPSLWPMIKPLVLIWKQALKQSASLHERIRRRSRKDQVCQLLMSVPGVGVVTASAYVATIDDPGRFQSSEEVASYLGLVPRVYQSGETEYRGRITKEGDKLLRWLLVEAAHVLLSRVGKSCALKRWGKKLEKRKGYGKARVAVARKMAILLHRLWVKGEPFDWQRA